MRLIKNLPPWLDPNRDVAHMTPQQLAWWKNNQRYFTRLARATPLWMHEKTPFGKKCRSEFYAVYREMRRQRALGNRVVVDHVIPLCSRNVCGLNVPWNLRVIHEQENNRKANRYWPGCGFEPVDMLGYDHPPHQLSLVLQGGGLPCGVPQSQAAT